MYGKDVRKDSAAPAHARTRAHRPAAPHRSSGVSQTPHPTVQVQMQLYLEAIESVHTRVRARVYSSRLLAPALAETPSNENCIHVGHV